MGHIHQRVKLSAEKTATVSMLVDTGATFSVIPEALADAVGITRLRRSAGITLADGRRVRLDAGTAIFRIGDREAPATILVGPVAEPILGVETLEALGLTVDSRKQRLTPSRHYAVRLGGYGGGRAGTRARPGSGEAARRAALHARRGPRALLDVPSGPSPGGS